MIEQNGKWEGVKEEIERNRKLYQRRKQMNRNEQTQENKKRKNETRVEGMANMQEKWKGKWINGGDTSIFHFFCFILASLSLRYLREASSSVFFLLLVLPICYPVQISSPWLLVQHVSPSLLLIFDFLLYFFVCSSALARNWIVKEPASINLHSVLPFIRPPCSRCITDRRMLHQNRLLVCLHTGYHVPERFYRREAK